MIGVFASHYPLFVVFGTVDALGLQSLCTNALWDC